MRGGVGERVRLQENVNLTNLSGSGRKKGREMR